MRVRNRLGVLLAAASAFAVVLASPASAEVGTATATVTSARGEVTGTCTFVSSLPSQSFDWLEIALEVHVTADSPAWAVGAICDVHDQAGGWYGSAYAAGPGMAAAGGNVVRIPRTIVGPKICVMPTALWLDGTSGNGSGARKCTAL